MKLNLLFSIFIITFLFACKSDNEHKGHKSDHHQGSEVDHHMHKTPVSELIKKFESPERDAYQQPEKVLNFIGDLSGKKVLDIGAGSGYFSVRLAKRGAHVIAGDVDDEFLDYMNDRLKNEVLDPGSMEVKKMEFNSPGLKEGEVDKVLIVNTYHHIENRKSYFSAVYKGLKEGGELIVVDFKKKDLPIGPGIDHKFSMKEVMNELTYSGFNKFKLEPDLLEMQYIIKAVK